MEATTWQTFLSSIGKFKATELVEGRDWVSSEKLRRDIEGDTGETLSISFKSWRMALCWWKAIASSKALSLKAFSVSTLRDNISTFSRPPNFKLSCSIDSTNQDYSSLKPSRLPPPTVKSSSFPCPDRKKGSVTPGSSASTHLNTYTIK